jgi:hypothetical protein
MSTSTDEFASPASSTGIKWEDFKGSLLLFTVSSVEADIKTSFGDTDAIRADVTALDGAHAGESYTDTLVFPRVLQSQLRPNVGKKVLGRLGQGQAKPGQSAPWMLTDATDEDRAVATAYVAKNQPPPF